jgi:DNA topoisomerase-1
LPREVGRHPEDGEPIMASIGRYGPYVQHGKLYANLEPGDDVLTEVLSIGLNRAVALLAERKAKGPRKGRFGADPGRPLGEHPDKGGPVVVKNGRYGPYVSHDGVNATLPSDIAPDTITLEQAVPLLEARAARGPAKGKAAKGNKGKKQAPPKKNGSAEAAAESTKAAAPKSEKSEKREKSAKKEAPRKEAPKSAKEAPSRRRTTPRPDRAARAPVAEPSKAIAAKTKPARKAKSAGSGAE